MIGNQQLHYLRPSLIKSFVPDTCGEILFYFYFLLLCYVLNLSHFFFNFFLSLLERHFINFMNQDKDICILIILFDAL